MRVISGSAGRLKLISPKGMEVRPTTDRIKETLFNILAPGLPGCSFLDLFAGSGGIGIEALSRGAEKCYFVDNNKDAEKCINENLRTTKLFANGHFLFMDVLTAICGLYNRGERFDIIFMDPPYRKELERQVLELLGKYRLLNEDGMIIVEASADTEFDYLEGTCFEITREKKYGSNKHIFIAYVNKNN